MGLRSGQGLKNYVVQDLIATGGMGEVWGGVDVNTNRLVAIKAVSRDLVYDNNFAQRFLDEARRHSKLKHPKIVPVLDVFEADNQNCLVMALIEGESLSDLLAKKSNNRLDVREAISLVEDILNALNYAHMRGVIHRDVKPSNVLIDRNFNANLIDFGIALAVGEERHTRTGLAIGTPHYMSPEQIVTPGDIDHRSDVYSVGCVFYELVTGRPPFVAEESDAGDTDFALKRAHVTTKPVRPKNRVASIPDNVDYLIMSALEKDVANRIPGCGEFLRLLQNMKRPSRRSKWNSRVIATLLVLLVLMVIVFVIFTIG